MKSSNAATKKRVEHAIKCHWDLENSDAKLDLNEVGFKFTRCLFLWSTRSIRNVSHYTYTVCKQFSILNGTKYSVSEMESRKMKKEC